MGSMRQVSMRAAADATLLVAGCVATQDAAKPTIALGAGPQCGKETVGSSGGGQRGKKIGHPCYGVWPPQCCGGQMGQTMTARPRVRLNGWSALVPCPRGGGNSGWVLPRGVRTEALSAQAARFGEAALPLPSSNVTVRTGQPRGPGWSSTTL